MNTRISIKPRNAGYALLIVLGFVAVSLIILTGTTNRSHTVAKMNEHNNEYVVSMAAGEAATEKVVARIIYDYRNSGDNGVVGYMNSAAYATMIPTNTESSYWTNFEFSDGSGNLNRTYVSLRQASVWTNLGFEYSGLQGYASTYRIMSNVRQINARYTNIIATVQQDLQTAEIPLFQFAIFYNGLLEFTTCATMDVRGPVHANGTIYVGSSSALSFYNDVTASGMVQTPSYWVGQTNTSWGGAVNYYGNPAKTNVTTLTLPIGTNNTAAAVREVLYPPPNSNEANTNSAMWTNRLYNKAQMIVLVSNTAIAVQIKSAFDSTPTNLNWTSNNLAFFINTNISNFYDDRENTTNTVIQIDIGKFKTWADTNLAVRGKLGTFASTNNNVPNLLYVGDYRTASLGSVRLTNGLSLPTNNADRGFSVVTPNPLYVMGNYNVPNSVGLGTNITTYSAPAALFSDALTILSTNWVNSNYDTVSTTSYSSRPAAPTTVDAAILTGVVYSTGSAQSQFSGGVHNLPRLLEDWNPSGGGQRILTLNTSIINLFDSVKATNQFIYPNTSGAYYTAPKRQFYFDVNLSNPAKQPPGTPKLLVPIRVGWANPPPSTTNYVGW